MANDCPVYNCPVYLVGSCERHFIVDRVFLDAKQAIDYCESRKNNKYAWAVNVLWPNCDWWSRETIHRTEKEP